MLRPVAVCAGCKSIFPDDGKFCPVCGAPAAAHAPQAVAPGARIDLGWGQLLVQTLLGEGGMGTVYSGWLYYNPLGPRAGAQPHPVAVKVLHPLLITRPHVRKLFVGEASALRRLCHPNIVKFFELIEPAGQLAIVIEFVDGEALDKVIARSIRRRTILGTPCIPFARAWHYFEQLLGALAATHELNIVHRDVKPANLLVRKDGLAKLTDFGIARLPADSVQQTGGIQPGTGAYMSPEQVLGRNLDGRSDLYGAAIVMFEMLVGTTPFEDQERGELVVRAAQVEETPPPLTRYLPSAPPALDIVFARALAKDPANRFASAIELGNAFRAAVGLPVSTGWVAQQNFAKHATGIVARVAQPRSRGGTKPITIPDPEAMRQALAGAYRS